MKIVSFNINSVRARLHQLQTLIDQHSPEIIGLQETKVDDPEFPQQDIEAMGYHVTFHGQKGHYGVALLSKEPATHIEKGFPTEDADAQRRMIIGRWQCPDGQPITVLNGYFPQGENIEHPTKFPYKRNFYSHLQQYLETHLTPEDRVLVIGDFNISPSDLDIGIGEPNRKRWLREGKTSFQPEEREWLSSLEKWGLSDTYRYLHPAIDDRFSWFDYRSKGFDREPRRGLRIDLLMASPALLPHVKASDVDYDIRSMEKPSDHAPVWTEFSF
ncbi:exodeoxyribonuclease III [Terasakiispira papahanaumokuakeensis]|uniref:Exodeoxyribonuclease III n=1 Tax=Terasakiispira papahanaumokuakeensis TaxID=197479 RepID=A0A1E2V9R4_9GAMM|nr:exodeoxyribonuclease III [Terasakiispira papahanaumokuakeensis]ODC03602.1 exodeoxyribonuclease III [Terasakiispira papahanaumokuakeensis]